MTWMHRGLLLAVLVAALVAVAATPASTPIRFGKAEAVLTTERSRVILTVEVARTGEQQARGLMFRRWLAPKAGMAFVYTRDTRGAFWMKNTLIPLSIAFYNSRGKILRIMQMEPCEADPCRLYDPGVAYRGALEVNQGAFGRWRVNRGDTIRLRTPR